MKNRELQLALLLVLAGAALLLLGAGRDWIDIAVPQAPPLPSSSEVRTGSNLVAALSPLGLVGLAGLAALAATKGRGRVLVGVLLVADGAAAVAATVHRLGVGALAAVQADRPGLRPAAGQSFGFTSWPYVVLLAGALLALGGLVVALRGRRWAAMSARYEAPAARTTRPARPEVEAWEALDRGEDPTADAHAPQP